MRISQEVHFVDKEFYQKYKIREIDMFNTFH